MDKLFLEALIRQAEAEAAFASRIGDRRSAKSIRKSITRYRRQLVAVAA